MIFNDISPAREALILSHNLTASTFAHEIVFVDFCQTIKYEKPIIRKRDMSCFSLTSFLKLIPPFYLELFLYSIQFYSSVYSFRVEVSLAVIFFLVFILIVIG